MASIKDDRGFNQGFKPSLAMSHRMKRRAEYIASQMIESPKTSVLEIGCGTGEVSFLIAQKTKAQVIGTDICLPFIKAAKKRYKLSNLSYSILDFNNVQANKDFRNKKYDYVVGNGILHHLYYDLDEALASINKLLTPGGKMIFLEPNIINPYIFVIFKIPFFRKKANLEPAEMAFTKQYISKKLADNKFSNIHIEHKDFLLPNTPRPLIKTIVTMGNILEKIPIIKNVSQSIYVSAQKLS